MKLLPLLIVGVLFSCSSTPKRNPLQERLDAGSAQISADAQAMLIPADSPLIAEDFVGSKLAETKKDICEKKKGCDAQVKEALHARWKERYKAVQFDTFLTYCKGYPKECRDLINSEKGLRQTHNNNVIAHRDALLAQWERDFRASVDATARGLTQNAANQNAQYQQGINNQSQAPKNVDLSCVQRCQATGSLLPFCQAKCTY